MPCPHPFIRALPCALTPEPYAHRALGSIISSMTSHPRRRVPHRREPARGRAGRRPGDRQPGPPRSAGLPGASRRRLDVHRGAPAARGGPAAMGRHPRSGTRSGDPAPGRARHREQREAVAAHHRGDRQADRRVPRRGAGGDRHLRLLPVRRSAAVRHDGAERAAGQAAVYVSDAGRTHGDHYGGKLPGRGAELVPRARDVVWQRRRVEARRVHAGDRGGVRPADLARRGPDWGVAAGARGRAAHLCRPGGSARGRTDREGWVHGLERGRSPRSGRSAGAIYRARASSSGGRTRSS